LSLGRSLGEEVDLDVEFSVICQGQRIFELFTHYSHHCPSRPASGLRLEISPNLDKKKSELYFSGAVKKFLTENGIGAPAKMQKILLFRQST
jgi:hypothetical protein